MDISDTDIDITMAEIRGTGLRLALNLPLEGVEAKLARMSDAEVTKMANERGYRFITAFITNSVYRMHVNSIFGSDNTNVFEASTPVINALPSGELQVFHSDLASPLPQTPDFELEHLSISPGPHLDSVIAMTAHWAELDSQIPLVAKISLDIVIKEIQYGSLNGLHNFIIMGPKSKGAIAQYAQAISHILRSSPPFIQLIIRLPFMETLASNGASEGTLKIWDIWNSIRTMCGYPSNLSVALNIPKVISALDSHILSRWLAEPVTLLFLATQSFVPNSKGFPVLHKSSQDLLSRMFQKKDPVVIVDDAKESQYRGGPESFQQYSRYVYKKVPALSKIEIFADGYFDRLQDPLQPLSSNIESVIYDAFERDPVKYAQYERAIHLAILDRPGTDITLAVLGAGRGPLVTRALKAAAACDRHISIYAVEKNHAAYIELQRKKQEWKKYEGHNGSKVQIFLADMREWKPPVPLTIIVSELLGSFSDNELSPECLENPSKYLDSQGVMIPARYTAFHTPAMSSKLYCLARDRGLFPSLEPNQFITSVPTQSPTLTSLNTPYTVMLRSVDFLSPGDFRPAWTFDHNNRKDWTALNPVRMSKETFKVPHRGVLHGIAGFFEAVLYKDVCLSTCPNTIEAMSKDLVSWFPMWFPLMSPVYCPDNAELDISLWRLCDERRVWYEWSVDAFTEKSNSKANDRMFLGSSQIHNAGGKHFSMLKN